MQTSTTTPSTRRRAAVAALVALGASAALVAPAAAKDGGGTEVRASGRCEAGATRWDLKAKPDDGRLEVEAEIDSNRVGQVWTVTITDNGVVVFRGSRTTAAPSGAFEVEVHPADRAGADHLQVVARRNATGATCTGSVTLG